MLHSHVTARYNMKGRCDCTCLTMPINFFNSTTINVLWVLQYSFLPRYHTISLLRFSLQGTKAILINKT